MPGAEQSTTLFPCSIRPLNSPGSADGVLQGHVLYCAVRRGKRMQAGGQDLKLPITSVASPDITFEQPRRVFSSSQERDVACGEDKQS